ncbi:MAG: FAD-dependent oxidoreductase, partial [Candidatus Berkelbacteria bacterium]|nr:FAD-dependent oxidoreductase [Candidatus Berkelbacteria bacterium]
GKKPRELNVPGEEKFKGKGVSYCAICDAPFYKKKVVVIAGDGNSALHAAITAAEVASHVYLIAKHDKFIGEEILIDKVKSYKNVKIFMATKIAEICGDKKVDSIRLESGEEIKTDGIIIEIGHEIDRTLIKDLVKLDEKNQVIIDNMQNTSVPGIFAAGDLTNTPYNQIVISAGEGAKASLSVFNYLQSLKQK